MKSSQAAVDLIVEAEVSSPSYYDKHYANFEWPGGASGATVGVGFDCGYCSRAEIIAAWSGLVPPATLAMLQMAAGITGTTAQLWVKLNQKAVTIPWATAETQFKERELPKWEKKLDAALPNTDLLPPDSYGALVSLIYNRGTSGFTAAGDRYREMHTINALMQGKNFNAIPAQIRAMKRLWSNGLVARREREAILFENGLRTAAGQIPQSLPTRGQTVLRTVTTAGSAIGTGAGSAVYLASSSPHAHWSAALAFASSLLVAAAASLHLTRHRLTPRADP